MKLSVIGAGYVGLTTAACLAQIGHDVFCSESDLQKLTKLQDGVMPLFEPHWRTSSKLPATLAGSISGPRRTQSLGETQSSFAWERRHWRTAMRICLPSKELLEKLRNIPPGIR